MKATVLGWLGEKQLLRAAERGDAGRVRALIGRGINPSAGDPSGRTALHYAAAQDHAETVRTLLVYGADPNIRDRVLGYTPLNIAVRNGEAEIVELLLNHGADVRRLHDRLLERAMRNEDTPIALLLRQHGARMAHEPAESDRLRIRPAMPANGGSAYTLPPRTPREAEGGAEPEAEAERVPESANGAARHNGAAEAPAASRESHEPSAGSAVAEAPERTAGPRNGEPVVEQGASAAGEAGRAAEPEPTDPELAAVVRAWPTLSQPMRAAILAMLDAAEPRPPAPQRVEDPPFPISGE